MKLKLMNTVFILTSTALVSGSLYAAEIRGKVIRVLDGDTIDVLQDKTPVRIRLANIDAPEKKQAYGRWSANQLKVWLQRSLLR